jgi:hypothetical protein
MEVTEPTGTTRLRDNVEEQAPARSKLRAALDAWDVATIAAINGTTLTPVTVVSTKKGHAIDVATNDATDELKLDDPLLTDSMMSEFPTDKLREGMNEEMDSMRHFNVYTELRATDLTDEERRQAIKTRWVLRWKGNKVRARLVAKGYSQRVDDPDDTYASTPLLTTLKLLLLFGLDRKFRMRLGDISTAFLHATLREDEKILIKPPEEYYPGKDVYWRLNRPLYGLKTAPKAWQDHFASVLTELGGRRLKSDPNVYHFPTTNDYVMVYVDDLIILGDNPDPLFDSISKRVLLKDIGELKEGQTVNFLGRRLRHQGQSLCLARLQKTTSRRCWPKTD